MGKTEENVYETCPTVEIFEEVANLVSYKKDKFHSNPEFLTKTESVGTNTTTYNYNFKNSILNNPPVEFAIKEMAFKENIKNFSLRNIKKKPVIAPIGKGSGIKITNIVHNGSNAKDPKERQEMKLNLKNVFHLQIPAMSPKKTMEVSYKKTVIANTASQNAKYLANNTGSNVSKRVLPILEKTIEHSISEKKDPVSRNEKKLIVNNKELGNLFNSSSKKSVNNPFGQNISYFGKFSNLPKPITTKNSSKLFNTFERNLTSTSEKDLNCLTSRVKTDSNQKLSTLNSDNKTYRF